MWFHNFIIIINKILIYHCKKEDLYIVEEIWDKSKRTMGGECYNEGCLKR